MPNKRVLKCFHDVLVSKSSEFVRLTPNSTHCSCTWCTLDPPFLAHAAPIKVPEAAEEGRHSGVAGDTCTTTMPPRSRQRSSCRHSLSTWGFKLFKMQIIKDFKPEPATSDCLSFMMGSNKESSILIELTLLSQDQLDCWVSISDPVKSSVIEYCGHCGFVDFLRPAIEGGLCRHSKTAQRLRVLWFDM